MLAAAALAGRERRKVGAPAGRWAWDGAPNSRNREVLGPDFPANDKTCSKKVTEIQSYGEGMSLDMGQSERSVPTRCFPFGRRSAKAGTTAHAPPSFSQAYFRPLPLLSVEDASQLACYSS